MRATNNGLLADIDDCWIDINGFRMVMNIIPDITDGKSASYADESAIGRTMPFKTYQYSENRTIGWTAHFIIQSDSNDPAAQGVEGAVTATMIFKFLRNIESAVYPINASDFGYAPPNICLLRCGGLLQKDGWLNAVLKSYSVKFDTSVPWHSESLLPYKLDVDMQFDVVYNQTELPGGEQILGEYGPGWDD